MKAPNSGKGQLQSHFTFPQTRVAKPQNTPPNPAKNRRQRKKTNSQSDTSASQQTIRNTRASDAPCFICGRSSRPALPRGTGPDWSCDGTGREESRLGRRRQRRRRRAISSPGSLADRRSPQRQPRSASGNAHARRAWWRRTAVAPAAATRRRVGWWGGGGGGGRRDRGHDRRRERARASEEGVGAREGEPQPGEASRA